jgi:cytidylate kinase
MNQNRIPIVTIDGPSGSGKGTISRLMHKELGWHYLDSGALYRILAFSAESKGMSFVEEAALAELAKSLQIQFIEIPNSEHIGVYLDQHEITTQIRTEEMGEKASKVAAFPSVREALVMRQRAFLQPPGLIADGRDMGTVIFPEADLKIFLEASLEERAERRFNQLKKSGVHANLQSLFSELSQRDARDRQRVVCPLKPAQDAVIVDTTGMPIEEVLSVVRREFREKGFV